jgi:predicted ATPase/class 3 adenylate cyclase
VSVIPEPTPAVSRPLPSGTVTFAFTDIEGSTQRWDQHAAAMEKAVRRHDALMRASIARHHGHVFKTIGDAFCAAFARPADAVAAILEAQRALATEDFSGVDGLRVRAAIHTGTADERDGDYFGSAVNRVARLLAIGHGGQALVSRVSADLVRGDLPPLTSLRDLGEHRLKDLARPEYVYQLVAPGLAAEFPPLRSLDQMANNLPRIPKSLVGRHAEIAEITALLLKHQVVTLVGSGGVGKTRAALEVAVKLLDRSGDGVWLIELAPLASGDYIPAAVAQALGIKLAPDGHPLDNLVLALKSKRALLVFDNCEHLIAQASHIIAVILRSCPQIRVLATSRQGLGIASEASYHMPSLSVPGETIASSLAASHATEYAAIELFVERAQAVDRRFRLTDENAPIIADICRRLDGIPLAIELAASRIKVVSPRQLRDRLNERFRVLTGGSRDVLPRHQTLRALFDWSHDLLNERERLLFRRLGVFINGFTLEGAVAVASTDELDELEVLDVLSSLVDKSLVLTESNGGSLRYRLLESTRNYAAGKLSDAGESGHLAARHLNYLRERFAQLRERAERTARATEYATAFRVELEDLRVALDGAFRRADALGGAALLAEAGGAWAIFGIEGEGIVQHERFLKLLPPTESLLLARLSTTFSSLFLSGLRKTRALEVATQAVAYARVSGDDNALADALGRYSWICLMLDQPDEAARALVEAESIAGGSTWVRVKLLRSRAFLSFARKNYDAAASTWERLRKEHRALGNAAAEQSATLCLAEVEHGRGQTQRAITLVREICDVGQNVDASPTDIGTALSNLAGYLVAIGDLAGAAEAARDAAGVYAREPDHAQVAFAIEHLALVHALRGDLTRAAVLEGYADAACRQHGSEREFTETATHDRLKVLFREQLAADELARLAAEGAAMAPEVAIALALDEG